MTAIKTSAAMMLLIMLTGCGSGENNVTIGNREQILHWGNGTEPQILDPHIATGVPEHKIIISLMEGLVLKDPRTLEPIPGVAESWDISDDGLVYTFHLRHNARWSNGDPHDARDYVWSWWRALQPALGNLFAYMYFSIENAEAYYRGDIDDFSRVGVKALDDYTLQVHLKSATPYFLQLLDHYSMFPVHRATVEKFGEPDQRGTRWTYEGNLVSNGAFRLKEWKLNRYLMVEKNPYYWRADTVRLQRIYYYPTENLTTEERMFRAGQLHYTYEIPVDKIEVYRRERPEALHIFPYLGSYFYRFNTRLPYLSDKRVRRALAMAIDRKRITDQVLKAGQIPSYAITPPDTMGYFPDSDLHYDPEAARQLLAAAGYPGGKGFPKLEILYNTHEEHRKVAVAIQQMWKKNLNIDVAPLNQEWKVYLDSESNGNYQVSRASWIGDYVDPVNFLELWLCGGGNNRTGWCNREYDRLLTEASVKAESREERYQLLREAEKILIQEMPVMPIYIYTTKHLVHPAVQNYYHNLLNQPAFRDIYLEAGNRPENLNQRATTGAHMSSGSKGGIQ